MLALILSACLIALAFGSGKLDKRKVWEAVKIRQEKESGEYLAQEGYGIKTSGPGYHLPAGRYEIQWQIDGDGENQIHILTKNDAAVMPDCIVTKPGEWGKGYFELKEPAANLEFGVEFVSGSYMNIRNIRLVSPAYKDHAFSISFLIAGAFLIYILTLSGWMTRERAGKLILLLAAVLAASLPSLMEDTRGNTDTIYHVARIMNLADGLRAGQFPVRLGGYSYNGYGAVTSVFYPGLFLYPCAAMVLLGASVTYVLQMYLAAMNLLAALLAYTCMKRIFRKDTALIIAIVYTLADYRIYQGYVEPRIGVAAVMAVFPLFFLGLWQVLLGDKEEWPALAAGAVLICQNHMLSAGICGLLAVLAGMACLKKVLKEKRLASILKAAGASVLLCLPQLAPFAAYRLDGVTTMPYRWLPQNTGLEAGSMLLDSQYLGAGMIVLAVCFLWQTYSEEGSAQDDHRCAMWFGLACLFGWCATRYFPWAYLSVLTRGASDVLQFPMRMLVVTVPLLAVCGGYALSQLLKAYGRRAPVLVLALAVLAAQGNIQRIMNRKVLLEFGRTTTPVMDYPEYLYEGTKPRDTISRQPETMGGVQVRSFVKDGYRMNAEIETGEEGTILLPFFGYDGLTARLDGKEISWTRGENNRMKIALQGGASGHLSVDYRPKALWMVADIGAALTAAGLCARTIRRRRARQGQPH